MIAAWWWGCGGEALERTAVELNPLTAIDRDVDRSPYVGTVSDVREAGPYAYVEVDGRWLVGLDKGLAVGDPLRVAPLGVARDFTSRRTGVVYDELWFAVLSANPTP